MDRPFPDPASRPLHPRKRDPSRAGLLGARRVLGMRVDGARYASATEAILDQAVSGGGTTCVATVHMVMEAFDDPDYRRIVNGAELVASDGMPLVWALRLLGLHGAGRVYGPDLTPIVCAAAAEAGLSVGFYGGTPAVVDALCAHLRACAPGLEIAFAWAPPFAPLTPEEDAEVTEAIRASGVRILFVGLGCPKQERWMLAHHERLDCAQVGVGAAFDFLAGAKRQAPRFLMAAGLEWLFRLVCEPRRLWRRYAIQNPRFVWHFARQLVRSQAGARSGSADA